MPTNIPTPITKYKLLEIFKARKTRTITPHKLNTSYRMATGFKRCSLKVREEFF